MGRLTSAINRARKLVREKDKAKNVNSNQFFVCTEWNKELAGALVVIVNNKAI